MAFKTSKMDQIALEYSYNGFLGRLRVNGRGFPHQKPILEEGREGVKCELGLALLWTGKMGFTHWDWDLATGNGMNNYKMGMGFLFFSGLCSNILK